jgi:hypothetical protein
MTRYASGPVSVRQRDETTARPPRTAVGIVPFVVLPVAVVLAVSLPVTAAAVVGGFALAELHRRARTAWQEGEDAPIGRSRWTTHDA